MTIGGNLVGVAGASCAQLGSRASQAAGGLGSAAGKPLKALAKSGAREATKLATAGARKGAQLAAAGAVRLASLKATSVAAGPRRGSERRAPWRTAAAAAEAVYAKKKQQTQRIDQADKKETARQQEKKGDEAVSQSEADVSQKQSASPAVDWVNKGEKKRPMMLPRPEEEEQARFDAALRAVRKRRRLGLARAAPAA